MTFDAAMDALIADARRWDETADGLEDAARRVFALPVQPHAFSFAAGGVSDLYSTLQGRVYDLLVDGGAQTGGAATALRQVRASYESADQSARDRIVKLWTWES